MVIVRSYGSLPEGNLCLWPTGRSRDSVLKNILGKMWASISLLIHIPTNNDVVSHFQM